VQLKEFSLIAPVIESADVFAALETVIPPDMSSQTLGKTESFEERVSQASLPAGGLFGEAR